MKKVIAALVLALSVGCASVSVTKIKGDDAVVSRSVQAERMMFNAADTLFKMEYQLEQQQAQGVTLTPALADLSPYTDVKRLEVPRVLVVLRTNTRLYRQATTTPKPDVLPVVQRAEALAVEMQARMTALALSSSHLPGPLHARSAAALTTGNPYVDAAVQLIDLINTGLGIYNKAQAQAVANGVLVDADENLLHVREDTALASPEWQR